MPSTAAVLADTVTTPFSSPPSSTSSLLSADASPDLHPMKRLSPSLSPVISDHQLPTLGSLTHRSSVSSTSSGSSTSSSPFRMVSPPLRALRRRSKSFSSFTSALQQPSSLPVLMKPYRSSPSAAIIPTTCSSLSVPSGAYSLQPFPPCLSPSVAQSSGVGQLRPRSKSFSVYEDQQASAAQQQRGRISARLPAMRVAHIAERPAVDMPGTYAQEEQPLVELKEEVENEGTD